MILRFIITMHKFALSILFTYTMRRNALHSGKDKNRAALSAPLCSLYYNVLLLNVSHNDTTSVSAYINSAVYLRVAADYLSNVAPLLCVIIDTLPCYSLVG